MTLPLRLQPQRFWAWAICLCIVSVAPIWGVGTVGYLDWNNFWIAGKVVGSAAIFDPAHGTFPYLPGSAWGLVPFAHLTLPASFIASRAFMLASLAAAGVVAGRVFGVSRRFAVMLAFAWAPCMSAVLIGQNATLGLLLTMVALRGLQTSSALMTAVPIGLLLYKPTYALPLIGLLAVRGLRRELAVVGAIAGAWYLLSVGATGGDWTWPSAWAHYLAITLGADLALNAAKTISIPGLMIRAGVTPSIAAAAGLAIAAAFVPLLRRVRVVEAGCAACLIGIVASPHAWGYDAVLALPMAYVATTRLSEPYRTPVVVASFIVAPLLLFSTLLGGNPVAAIVIGGLGVWTWVRGRATTTVPERAPSCKERRAEA